jgi:hypothetical protein
VNDISDEDYGITVPNRFHESDRLCESAGHDEASAIRSAADEVNLKWQSVVGAKDTEIAAVKTENAALQANLAGLTNNPTEVHEPH